MTVTPIIDAALIRSLNMSQGERLAASNQGEVRRHRIGELDLAIKRPSGRGLAWRLRRATLQREHEAYLRLQGLDGFAPCHGLFDRELLVLGHVSGQPFRDAAILDRERFFALLLTSIQAMHKRGVAHGDLKRKDNLLVTADGKPVILDLGAATLRKSGWHPLNQRLFAFMCQTDLNAWVKLKYGGYGNVPAQDAELLDRSWLERLLGHLRRP
ncbi:MAG: hypothetical protein JJU31_12990 [Wenzhouxiangella sp.]|nr:hypothetical protein [Wenzhouxiangella sp.]TVR96649.1 MAG: hypothetical protein EA418_05145 [Wenzhouxiangellaceae bacterium]